jgi:hypothetical protein
LVDGVWNCGASGSGMRSFMIGIGHEFHFAGLIEIR